jgi:antitoxin component YwqK of YwqJK toxin-antitoxin module
VNSKSLLAICFTLLSVNLSAQTGDSINSTDQNGMKQGHWIKKNSGGHTLYDGYFKDNQPIGKFIRFYENDSIQSVLVFSNGGNDTEATFYYPNGMIASHGMYKNQLKEGKWSFYSDRSEGILIYEEEYVDNLKNGLSVTYYPDKTPAEKIYYSKDRKTGEWTQYYPNGKIFLRANYIDDQLQGKFEVFYKNGNHLYSGQYKDDARNGTWYRYKQDGTLQTKIDYVNGLATNPELYIQESDYLDSLERNKGKIADPEKTGSIW